MKKTTAFLLAATLISPAAMAGHKQSHDYARVISAEPIVKIVRVSTPRQECWDEQVSHYQEPRQRSATPTIVGAVIGGLIGNELGHHSDAKKAGVLVGSVLGGSIGRDIGRKNAGPGHHYYTTEQVCQTYQDYHEEEHITGYRVSYKYHGNVYHTQMPHHPGDRIKVRVSVTPANHY
ncbi:MAG: glycine zipper 2TM domain-containing protein [Pseudomonadales bacterium]